MLTARALRPLSQTPRLARARLNSSQQRPATEPSTSGHGNTLLMVGVAAVALVAAGKMAYSSRRGDVSGPGDAGKIQPEEVSEAIQDDVEALKKCTPGSSKERQADGSRREQDQGRHSVGQVGRQGHVDQASG